MATASHSLDGDRGCGAPGSPRWNLYWILQLEGDELADFVLEIGYDKTVEAMNECPGGNYRRPETTGGARG